MRPLCVQLLRGDVGPADPDHRELVPPDPSGQHFFLSRRGIESPAVRVVRKGHWKGPFFIADDEHLARGSLIDEPPSLGDRRREYFPIPARGRRIGRVNELLTVRPEDGDDFLQCSRFGRRDQCPHRVLRRVANVRWRG